MIRSFVAINLSEEVADALRKVAEELHQLVPERSVRWGQVSGIHLTLKFLGNVAEADLTPIKEVLIHLGRRHSPFTFTVGGLGCFPDARRPRVIWVGLEEVTGALAALQRDVEKSLEPLGFESEKRAFHPHLTLGRTRRDINSSDRSRLGEVISSAAVGELGRVQAQSFRLMRSDLRPDGAVYTTLEEFLLSK